MKHGSLFSGIGGFDLAAEWMGWTNVFHCEWNDFGKKVLNHYWPEAISYGDITDTDFTIHRGEIDILTGGFPCQPYSLAGKRLGTEDDRHLWPEMLRAIREIQPTYVVGENVAGLISWNEGMVFEEVQTDLEAEGYEVQPVLLPACAVNAPHRRDRIWFVAHSKRSSSKREYECGQGEGESGRCDCEIQRLISDTSSDGLNGNKESKKGCNGKRSGVSLNESDTLCSRGSTTDTKRKRSPREEHRTKESRQHTETYPKNGWENFPTQPPIRSGDDGLPDRLDGITFPKWRNESIKAYGNAIVPQVAYQIFKVIEQMNS